MHRSPVWRLVALMKYLFLMENGKEYLSLESCNRVKRFAQKKVHMGIQSPSFL